MADCRKRRWISKSAAIFLSITMLHVLFVCTGNICRSPMAQGLLEHYLQTSGLDGQVAVDSAATHAFQTGMPPDIVAQKVIGCRDIAIGHLRARRIGHADFFQADYIAVMDSHNFRALHAMAPASQAHKIRLLLDFAGKTGDEIIDPYGGVSAGYEAVFEQIEQGVLGLLRELHDRVAAISVDDR